jgi:hypothetical protein
VSIGFAAACHRIFHRAIPALLSIYKIDDVHQLPSPLKGEVLFIKGLIHYLSRSTGEGAEQQNYLTLAAAVKLFSLRFSNAGSEWQHVLFDSNLKVDCFLEEQMFDGFIGLMFNAAFRQREQVNLFKNADHHFDGYDMVCRALVHRNELLRLQLFQCYAQAPPLKEITKQQTQTSVDFLNIGDKLLSYLGFPYPGTHRSAVNASQFKQLLPWLMKTVSQDPMHHFFLKSALQHLEGCIAPVWLKQWMFCGIIKLVMQSMKCYPTDNLALLDEWKMSYAAYLFCKACIFNQGRPEKGLAFFPLFGLKEVEICQYWQNVLTGLEGASQGLIKANLNLLQIQPVPSLGSRLYGFYPSKQSDNQQMPTPLCPQPH